MKKILTVLLALALCFGMSSMTMASPTTTGGSIAFKDGGVIIIPPEPEPSACPCVCPVCCVCPDDCDGVPVSGGGKCLRCPCNCDDDYEDFFLDLGVKNDLIFGTHNLNIFGKFDSANKPANIAAGAHNTGANGQYTGAEVINRSTGNTSIYVDISAFRVGGPTGTVTLAGFELDLVPESAINSAGLTTGYTQRSSVKLTAAGTSQPVLNVNQGFAVRAAWHGVLTTLQGSAMVGNAQAVLTWTSGVVVP